MPLPVLQAAKVLPLGPQLLLKAPPTERIIRIPSPYVDPDSVAAVEDSLKSSAQNPGYQLKSRYDNTFLFRMLTEYQTKGWEVMEMEFSVGGDPSSDSQILFVVLRRERQSVKNP